MANANFTESGTDQVHSDPPQGWVGVAAVTEGGRSPTGVTAAARKLECFGPRSWRRLKSTLSGLQPSTRRRRSRGRKQDRPRSTTKGQAPQVPQESALVDRLPEPPRHSGVFDINPRREPDRERWDLVRDEHEIWGDLDRDTQDRLRRWRRGDA